MKRNHQKLQLVVYTIGHSTRPIEEFIELLKAYDIKILVDIRTIPGSKRNQQFSQGPLARALEAGGIAYHHMKGLGGLRHTAKNSPNQGWRNKSFRGYADYMQTEAFGQALDDLIDLAKTARTAIMCAEAVPWRCHRSLVGDALTIRGISVLDIMSAQKDQPHKLTPFAHVEKGHLTYPPEQESLL